MKKGIDTEAKKTPTTFKLYVSAHTRSIKVGIEIVSSLALVGGS